MANENENLTPKQKLIENLTKVCNELWRTASATFATKADNDISPVVDAEIGNWFGYAAGSDMVTTDLPAVGDETLSGDMLSPLALILKKLSVLYNDKMEKLELKAQMLVEGLPYVGFDYSFNDGELILEYEEGTSIVEDNFNFADGDLIVTTTTEQE